MASGNMSHLVLAFVLLTLCWGGSMAQSGCTSVIIGMAPCLNYVTGSSKTPSSSCCSSLANVVKSQPQCLCTALNGSTLASLGININKSTALVLPRACNVKTPLVSRCNGIYFNTHVNINSSVYKLYYYYYIRCATTVSLCVFESFSFKLVGLDIKFI
ncbi:putative plant non-specific lipid-transfer protein/Par allergen [Helianthus annuus]|nr:putative plant non-specific lipid-transfer protein/Par allergen [Helianthus annuus]